jgi:hypothetical protein
MESVRLGGWKLHLYAIIFFLGCKSSLKRALQRVSREKERIPGYLYGFQSKGSGQAILYIYSPFTIRVYSCWDLTMELLPSAMITVREISIESILSYE